MKSIIILCTIVLLYYQPVDTRQCYDCFCEYNQQTSTGSCLSTDFQSNCTLEEYGNQVCRILSFYIGNNEQRYHQPAPLGPYQDSHFLETTESISLSNNTWLPAVFSAISYSCDWDGCNHPSLGQYLPQSFQMNINSSILDSYLLNGQSSSPICSSCIGCINGLTVTLCREQLCSNGICYIDEIHNYAVTAPDDCTYYFNSACQPFTDLPQTPSIQIRAVYYIDLPAVNQLEIDEVDIRCTKDLCNTLETVEYLKEQIQKTVNIHPDFQPNRPSTIPTSTTPSTTPPTTPTSTTPSTTPPTTPNNAITINITKLNVFFYFIFALLLF